MGWIQLVSPKRDFSDLQSLELGPRYRDVDTRFGLDSRVLHLGALCPIPDGSRIYV